MKYVAIFCFIAISILSKAEAQNCGWNRMCRPNQYCQRHFFVDQCVNYRYEGQLCNFNYFFGLQCQPDLICQGYVCTRRTASSENPTSTTNAPTSTTDRVTSTSSSPASSSE